jgi:hypothetical protein
MLSRPIYAGNSPLDCGTVTVRAERAPRTVLRYELIHAIEAGMQLRRPYRFLALLGSLGCGLLALYCFRSAHSQEFSPDTDLSSEKAEFYWSRLRYTASSYGGYGGGGGFGYGYGGYGNWMRDYPKADRQVLLALKRLTRIQMRPIEQIVDLDHDPQPQGKPEERDERSASIFDYPMVYAVQVASWTFTDAQAKRLREYLLKGGFLMVDDFHGTQDWDRFMEGMRQVFPDRPVEDVPDSDEIFHTLYDLGERFQVPGEQYVFSGRTYEKDGYVPKWRAIRDDKGRIMVAICHNMHLGDAWEWADQPEYPENFASLAYRLALNYVVYGMTH